MTDCGRVVIVASALSAPPFGLRRASLQVEPDQSRSSFSPESTGKSQNTKTKPEEGKKSMCSENYLSGDAAYVCLFTALSCREIKTNLIRLYRLRTSSGESFGSGSGSLTPLNSKIRESTWLSIRVRGLLSIGLERVRVLLEHF